MTAAQESNDNAKTIVPKGSREDIIQNYLRLTLSKNSRVAFEAAERLEKLGAGLEAYQSLAKSDDPDTAFRAAERLEQLGDQEAARESYRRHLDSPNNWYASRAADRLEKLGAGLEAYQHLAESDDPDTAFRAAERLEQLGEHETVRATYRRFAAVEDARVAFDAAQQLERFNNQQDQDAAQATYRQLISSKNLTVAFDAAGRLEQIGGEEDQDAARATYRRLAAAEDARVAFNAAQQLERFNNQQDQDAAQATYRQLISSKNLTVAFDAAGRLEQIGGEEDQDAARATYRRLAAAEDARVAFNAAQQLERLNNQQDQDAAQATYRRLAAGKDPRVAFNAARQLERLEDNENAKVGYLRASEDPDPYYALDAAIKLERFDKSSAQATYTRLLDSYRAFEAASRLEELGAGPEAYQHLAEAQNFSTALRAAKRLEELGDQETARATYRRFAAAEDVRVAVEAAGRLEQIGSEEDQDAARATYRQLISSKNLTVAFDAAGRLEQIGGEEDQDAARATYRRLAAAEDADVAFNAAQRLEQLDNQQDQEAARTTYRRLAAAEDARVAFNAAQQLERLEDNENADEVYRRLAASSDPEIALESIKRIEELSLPEVQQPSSQDSPEGEESRSSPQAEEPEPELELREDPRDNNSASAGHVAQGVGDSEIPETTEAVSLTTEPPLVRTIDDQVKSIAEAPNQDGELDTGDRPAISTLNRAYTEPDSRVAGDQLQDEKQTAWPLAQDASMGEMPGSTELRSVPPEIPPGVDLRHDAVVATVWETVLHAMRQRSEYDPANHTLDVHVAPAPTSMVREIAGEPAAHEERVYHVTLTLTQPAQNGSQRHYFEGPVRQADLRAALDMPRDDRQRGARLHGALFNDDMPENADRLLTGRSARATLASGYRCALDRLGPNEQLRVQLRIDSSAAELQELGWEYLWDASRSDVKPLACSANTPLARVLQVSGANDAVPLVDEEHPLRILAATASPEPEDVARGGLAGLDTIDPSELETLIESLVRIGPSVEQASENSIEAASLDAIRERLQLAADQGQPYHVLHLLCHGVIQDGKAALVLKARDRRRTRLVQDTKLAEELGPFTPNLRLVTLASCFTAIPLSGQPLRGVARALMDAWPASRDCYAGQAFVRGSPALFAAAIRRASPPR